MIQSSVRPRGIGLEISALLIPLLHPDLIAVVLGYQATIHFELLKVIGGSSLSEDGDMQLPSGLLLHDDELFVVDKWNHRIQVFHQRTGRFLRKWGRRGEQKGEFIYPLAVTIHAAALERDGMETEIFIADPEHIHVFRLFDSRFLRRFKVSENWSQSRSADGIVALGDHIFLSRSDPNQIDVLTQSHGTTIRIIGDLSLGPYQGKLHLDEDGKELLVADYSHDRVLAVDILSGKLAREYTDFPQKDQKERLNNHPQAAAVHGEEVIVCCVGTGALVVFDRSTTLRVRVIPLELIEGTPSRLSSPCDLAVSSCNELFVCDSFRNRVLVFQ